VEYPYLENGSYIFQVSAKVENGKYNTNTAEIKFQISPPFYKKTWFIILSITILITLIVWAATFKLKIQKQKLELANANLILDNEKILYEKNLIELEQKALSLQMNPHFIFNAMNAIKGFYSSNDKESANEYIDKFSFLMRMILEKSNEEKISLNDELLITELYLQLALLRFDKKFNYYITVDQKINKNGILIPPMITQPFIENSVIHGIAPLSKIGKIEINYHIDSNYLICKIKDNGIGINESIKIKNKHFHTSKGISITKQRLMNLYINKGDQIKPISIESDASIGTTVTLTIPLK
jgi:LytS/YehU family sensor histidine kinase